MTEATDNWLNSLISADHKWEESWKKRTFVVAFENNEPASRKRQAIDDEQTITTPAVTSVTQAMQIAEDLKVFASKRGLGVVYQRAVQIEAEALPLGISTNYHEGQL